MHVNRFYSFERETYHQINDAKKLKYSITTILTMIASVAGVKVFYDNGDIESARDLLISLASVMPSIALIISSGLLMESIDDSFNIDNGFCVSISEEDYEKYLEKQKAKQRVRK